MARRVEYVKSPQSLESLLASLECFRFLLKRRRQTLQPRSKALSRTPDAAGRSRRLGKPDAAENGPGHGAPIPSNLVFGAIP